MCDLTLMNGSCALCISLTFTAETAHQPARGRKQKTYISRLEAFLRIRVDRSRSSPMLTITRRHKVQVHTAEIMIILLPAFIATSSMVRRCISQSPGIRAQTASFECAELLVKLTRLGREGRLTPKWLRLVVGLTRDRGSASVDAEIPKDQEGDDEEVAIRLAKGPSGLDKVGRHVGFWCE